MALLLFDVLVPIVFTGWVVLLLALELTAVRRGHQRVERWASAASYQVQSVVLRRVRTGPFGYLFNGASNRIFEVVITAPSKEPRIAFLKVSGGLFGLAADKVEVRWVPDAES